eukprot:GDKI01040028.1.p2 GENE.GDKI01040028.1~~GDKI01040028.1.p2  ORF type:complete len:177 (+),score=87.05 GDKI01040028.1:36-566(+)
MKVFKDAFTGDELMSDSYKHQAPFGDDAFADVAFEVTGKFVVKGAEDFGISANVDEDAAEGATADGGADVQKVIDIVDGFKYVETGFTKAEFGTYIKGYMVRVKKYLEEKKPDRVDAFMKGAQTLVKKILSQYSDFQFFMGESMDAEAGLVYAYYPEDAESPNFIYFKDGLKEEKY